MKVLTIRNFIAATFLQIAILMALTSPVMSQEIRCGEHADVIASLFENYGERVQSIGLGSNGAMVEVYASIQTGTWTILVTLPAGQTCLVAAGTAFAVVKEKLDPAGFKI